MAKKSFAQQLLESDFFVRPTVYVARDLIGKYLVKKEGATEHALMITEVEAYDGQDDRASHASRGQTRRNSVMFGPAGHFYIYFIYGMYFMLNVVTGPVGYPAAILIRGTSEISGPGRLTKHLGITAQLNAKPALEKSGLWFEDRGITCGAHDILTSPRIGVAYAGKKWASKPYRFVLPFTREVFPASQ